MRFIFTLFFLLMTSVPGYCTVILQDEGNNLGAINKINCNGSAVSCDKEGSTGNITVNVGEGGGATVLTDLSDVHTSTKTPGNILVADGTDFESRSLSGDATVNGSGVVTLTNGSLGLSELSDVNTATATAGNILVADGTDFESMALQGDCHLNGAGFIVCTASSGNIESGLQNYIPKYATGGTTLTSSSSIFENSDGNVGIGSDSPDNKLDVGGTLGATNIILKGDTDNKIQIQSSDDNESKVYQTVVYDHQGNDNDSYVQGFGDDTAQRRFFQVNQEGSIAIGGIPDADYALFVHGTLNADSWNLGLAGLTDTGSVSPNSGRILVADGTNWNSVALHGDCTIDDSTGLITCVASGEGGGGTSNVEQLSDLTDVHTSTATAGNILIGDGTDFESVNLASLPYNVATSGTLQTGQTATIGSSTKSRVTFTHEDYIDGFTDDVVKVQGVGGSDNTDLSINVDGAAPKIYSATDTTVIIDDILQSGSNGTDGILKLYNELGGTDYTTTVQNSNTQSANITWTLPPTDCNADEFLMSDGSGVLTCEPISGVTASSGDITAVGDCSSGSCFKTGGSGTTLLSPSGVFATGGIDNTNNEKISCDYETTANQVACSSSTGVTRTLNSFGTNYTGNVGIGTTAVPVNTLQVNGVSEFNGKLTTTSGSFNFSPFLGNFNVGQNTSVGSFAMNVFKGTGDATNMNHKFSGTGNSFLAGISGNVGIGTTVAPTGKLEVRGGPVKVWTGTGVNDNATSSGELYVQGDIETDGFIYGDGSHLTGIGTAGDVALADLTDVNTSTATAGRILVADGTDFESVALQGDCTINGAGFITCSTSSGATHLTGLSDVHTATATAGRILVADGTDFESMAVQGDVTLNGAGFIDLAANSVGASEIASDSISTDELTFINSSTATAGRILVADGTDFESMALQGDASMNGAGFLSLASNNKIGSFGITVDGGGSAITTGIKGDIQVPYACTVDRWTVMADQSGSIVFDVWKDTLANYPPTVLDTIAGSEKPTLTSATNNQDTSLTTWTTSVSAGDTIRFKVDSASSVTRATVEVRCIKN